ncbi:MAG: HPr family phosphocarrier protein [Clostridia bacterium]|nr:HPr family phosphocarrier protein [Clostridia bacterium]
MKEFVYKITDSVGIHARPAGELVKKASEFRSDIKIKKGEKVADAKKIFSVMTLGAVQGDEITVVVEGADEESAFEEIKTFFEETL